jgi:tetratricopeptide (TPR) repeat protein
MRGRMPIRLGILGALCGVAAIIAPQPAHAQATYGYTVPETPAAALARHVRTLASSPNDFGALIGAGKAALALGDAQAAAGFFARADEVNPRSPLPQAGMGAVSVANGEAQAAMPYFTRAVQLGAAATQVGCDRGLAYDLLGQQARAQADYRAALNGPDADEARRRLALSLAISGDKAGALQTLTPLFAKRDPAAGRVRAFVLALGGDSNGAMAAIDAAMPGSWSRVAPFLQRLPALRPDEKAAAVNLGIFPDPNAPALASASSPTVASYSGRTTGSATTDRLAGIDELLRAPPPAPQPTWQPAPQQAQPPVQVAYAASVKRSQVAASQPRGSKIWLQLASGSNAEALPSQFQRIKSRGHDLFDGIKGYVARSPDRARLVIGPFRGTSDAQIFAEDLASVGVSSFRWTNSESDQIVPLGTE